MPQASPLPFGPLGARTVHLCVDMQNLFAEETPWNTPWMKRVLPVVTRIAEHHPERTVFTRFIPARHPAVEEGGLPVRARDRRPPPGAPCFPPFHPGRAPGGTGRKRAPFFPPLGRIAPGAHRSAAAGTGTAARWSDAARDRDRQAG